MVTFLGPTSKRALSEDLPHDQPVIRAAGMGGALIRSRQLVAQRHKAKGGESGKARTGKKGGLGPDPFPQTARDDAGQQKCYAGDQVEHAISRATQFRRNGLGQTISSVGYW
jgi:hypothetical protein